MIYKHDGFNIPLDFDEKRKIFTIYSYQRIVLHPQTKNYFSLPYKLLASSYAKYINFQIDKNLINNGLECIWNNLNEDSSEKGLIFLLKNSNIVFKDELNSLSTILGTGKKIDVIPNTVLGRVFI